MSAGARGAWLLCGVLLAQAAQSQSPYTNANEFLDPDAAFRMQVRAADAGGHRASWAIEPGYYLYKKSFAVRVGDEKLPLDLPEGEITDEFFGRTPVFRHHVALGFTAPAGTEAVSVTYQGCADAGLCYSPVTKTVTLAAMAGSSAPSAPPARDGEERSAQEAVMDMLQDDAALTTLLSFLLFGVLLAFTPCVLPVLPILFRTLTRTTGTSAWRAAGVSTVYVLAFSLVYSLLGVASGLLGESVQIWLQKPWLLTLFAVLFVLLAMSMFGVFRLQMPAAVQTRLNAAAGAANRGGGWLGSAGMGAFSALIVGPCVTPALIGALLFIAQTRDAVLGGAALFLLGFGMGLPLIAMGTYFGPRLPKPGAVRDTLNLILGFLLLGVSVWLADRVVSAPTTLLLGGAWLILLGVALFSRVRAHAKRATDDEGEIKRALVGGVCAVLALYGAVLVVGAALGGQSLIRPLSHLANAAPPGAVAGAGAAAHAGFADVKDLPTMYAAVNEAARDGRVTMVDFYADWCVSCKELEAFTFSDARVRAAFADMRLLRFDVTEDNATNKGLLKHFGLFGPPALLFFDAAGEEVRAARIVGFIGADKFLSHLERHAGAQ